MKTKMTIIGGQVASAFDATQDIGAKTYQTATAGSPATAKSFDPDVG